MHHTPPQRPGFCVEGVGSSPAPEPLLTCRWTEAVTPFQTRQLFIPSLGLQKHCGTISKVFHPPPILSHMRKRRSSLFSLNVTQIPENHTHQTFPSWFTDVLRTVVKSEHIKEEIYSCWFSWEAARKCAAQFPSPYRQGIHIKNLNLMTKCWVCVLWI